MKTFKAEVTLKDREHGFIGNRRVYGGDIIDVTEKQFSSKWMKRLRKEREVKATKVVKPTNKGLL